MQQQPACAQTWHHKTQILFVSTGSGAHVPLADLDMCVRFVSRGDTPQKSAQESPGSQIQIQSKANSGNAIYDAHSWSMLYLFYLN